MSDIAVERDPTRPILARGLTDAQDRLIEADEPLAGLHRRCGGETPGTVAIPQLLEVVRKARMLGLRLARTIEAVDGEELVRAWVEVAPAEEEHAACAITVGAWSSTPLPPVTDEETAAKRVAIDRNLAELIARLDPEQRVLAVEAHAPDLRELARAFEAEPGRRWSEFVTMPDLTHGQRVHWRLLDGARVVVPGSARGWTATIHPLGRPEPGSAGFELMLVADAPLAKVVTLPADPLPGAVFGQELTPVLRQPIARIIANAETIRSRLAGPLADEYSDYAADIAAAGQHLLSLVEDLSDLEVVEAHDFATAPDRIDLGDVARRAVGILAVRARAKTIVLVAPEAGEPMQAIGEFRRVLQVLLNLVGNAINYSPEGSAVTLRLDRRGAEALVTVIDEGPGLSAEEQARVFDKFERLGRGVDGGSGLGLYISRRLARAMGGDLSVAGAPGEGARFTLALPAAD